MALNSYSQQCYHGKLRSYLSLIYFSLLLPQLLTSAFSLPPSTICLPASAIYINLPSVTIALCYCLVVKANSCAFMNKSCVPLSAYSCGYGGDMGYIYKPTSSHVFSSSSAGCFYQYTPSWLFIFAREKTRGESRPHQAKFSAGISRQLTTCGEYYVAMWGVYM